MTPTATLDRPSVVARTESADSVTAIPPIVTRETTIHQIMREARVSYDEAEAFLDRIVEITQAMEREGTSNRHFTRTEIGELHSILKIVMKAKVRTPGEGTAHWMINRLVFSESPTLGVMHSSSRVERMTYCDATIVTTGN